MVVVRKIRLDGLEIVSFEVRQHNGDIHRESNAILLPVDFPGGRKSGYLNIKMIRDTLQIRLPERKHVALNERHRVVISLLEKVTNRIVKWIGKQCWRL
jgi:hypothetical protein